MTRVGLEKLSMAGTAAIPATARPRRQTRVVVVGSGLGGMTAALRADALGYAVTLVTKDSLGESNSSYAQGGIAAAVFADDSAELHVADTLAVGADLNVVEAVEALCIDGPERVSDLVRWGVRFDGDADGWHRGLEAAHSRARVLHAGGDATGAVIVEALVRRIRASSVTVVQNAFLVDLLVEQAGDVDIDGDVDIFDSDPDPRAAAVVTGVELLLEDGSRHSLAADAVVLATGGAGQLFEHTTNPAAATGDGLAAAWRAGAQVRDVEFYQFHPTALAADGGFLISEAVRGEGAVLLDAGGRRFMAGVDRRAELAPRDVVARGIADLMTRQHGHPALLDATAIGAETLRSRFPTITAATLAAGFDWTTTAIPVTPAAHYFMGGVSTDLLGRTTLARLYAVGEVAATGVHGANRLASNSLLEAAVFGWRVVEAIRDDVLRPATPDESTTHQSTPDESTPGGPGRPPVAPDTAGATPIGRSELQRLMWCSAGVERSGDGLRAAAERLQSAAVVLPTAEVGGGVGAAVDAPSAEAAAALREALETANLLDVARLVVAAALAREESRGAHFRSDFPQADTDRAHSNTWAREVSEHAHR